MKKIVVAALLFLAVAPLAWGEVTLQGVRGEVKVLKHGAQSWTSAEEAMTLEPGDKLKIGEESSVEILMDKGSVTLSEKTEFGVKDYQSTDDQFRASLELTLGRLKAKVDKLRPGSEFKVTTPTSVAAVRGTVFGLRVYGEQGNLFTDLNVDEDTVNFCTLDLTQCFDVEAGKDSTGSEGDVSDPDKGQEDEPEDTDEPKTIDDQYQGQKGFDQEPEEEEPEAPPDEEDAPRDLQFGKG
jgi:hypothetical protein